MSWNRTAAVASVAWPQRSTSVFGVNQRRENARSSAMGFRPRFKRKAVSDKFISVAIDCRTLSLRLSSIRQTAAGLPAKGFLVKAST
jgi:hypothetical protein